MSHTLPIFDSQSSLSLFVDKEQREQEKNHSVIQFLIEGSIQLTIEEKAFHMQPGDIIVINKFQPYSIQKKSKENLLLEFIVSDELLMQATEIDGIKFNCNSVEALDNQQYDDLRKNLHQIIEILLLKERRANFLLFSYVYQFLNDLISNFSVKTKIVTKKDLRIREMVQYVYDHYNEEITLQSLAEKFYLEPSYFSKFFKKHVGVNFKEYIVHLRLDFAENDLLNTDKAIARIAVDNGFSSVNSFNRSFKSAYGTTPSEFREKQTIEIERTSDNDEREVIERYKQYKEKPYEDEEIKDEEIIIDTKASNRKINSIWNKLVNVGRAEELLNDEMKKHVLEISTAMNYEYMRLWSIFNESLFTDWENYQILNFEKLDQIFDFLVENKISPWLVLNKENRKDRFIEEEISGWEKLFKQFLEHMINRYGIKVIKNWNFELILDNVEDKTEVNKYCQFFQVTKNTVKSISKEIQIGGASFKVVLNSASLKKILIKIQNLNMDFYSFMLFPYAQDQIKEERNSQRITDQDFLVNRMYYVHELLEGMPKKKVYISEWNNTVSNKNIINDTLYKGAYVVKNILDVLDLTDGLGYWLVSDLYHSNPDTTQFLNGGSGLVNKYGMYKPAMTGMKFFNEINGLNIVTKEKNLLVCEIDNDELLIIGHNYTHPNQLYFLKNESEILPEEVDSFFAEEKKELNIKLKNLDKGNYEVRSYSCNSQNGSLFDKWKELGFIDELRLSDLSYLEEKNTIHMELKQIEVKNKVTELKRLLEPNEFYTLHIRNKTRIDH